MKKLSRLVIAHLFIFIASSAKADLIIISTVDDFISSAVGDVANNLLTVTFSEPVYSQPDGITSSFNIGDFYYTDANSAGATALVSMFDGDGTDGVLGFIMDSNFILGDESDIFEVTVISIFSVDGTEISSNPSQVVPIPSAIWLFGSGLIGLIGVARRKKA